MTPSNYTPHLSSSITHPSPTHKQGKMMMLSIICTHQAPSHENIEILFRIYLSFQAVVEIQSWTLTSSYVLHVLYHHYTMYCVYNTIECSSAISVQHGLLPNMCTFSNKVPYIKSKQLKTIRLTCLVNDLNLIMGYNYL